MKKLLFTLLAVSLVIISSCNKEYENPDPKAIISSVSTAAPFDTVFVDGTKSENALNYQWTGSGPTGEIDIRTTNTPGKVYFVPAKNGNWQISLNVTNNGKYHVAYKDITVSGSIPIGGTLTKSLTLSDLSFETDSCDYFLTEDLIVPSGMELIIEDGVKICAAEGVGIIMEGRLTVRGSGYGVVIEPIGNNWKGIHLKNPYSVLSMLTIDGAGSSSFTSDPNDKAAIYAENSFKATQVTVKNSAGYGIFQKSSSVYFQEGTSVINFENNASGPGIFSFYSLKYFQTFDISKETVGTYLKLWGNTDASLDFIANLNIPYMLLEDIKVNSIQLYPGTELYCADGIGIQVESGILTNGYGDPILITGVRQSPGSWKGIYIKENGTASIKNVSIKYAGGSTWSTQFLDDVKAGLIVEGKVDIEECTFEYNDGYGLAALNNGDQSLNRLLNTSISFNAEGAMLLAFLYGE